MKKVIAMVMLFSFCVACDNISVANKKYLEKRQVMLKDQIIARGIKDKNVIRAMGEVKRHLFVPDGLKDLAYEDGPLPIGYDQTISQPFIVAYMTEFLQLKKDDRVLEIGTGSGYQAAILAEIVKEVYSIEIIGELAKSAHDLLESLEYKNIFIKHGDGYKGWKEHAPFDAIIVTAAPTEVPQKLVEQLAEGGRMILPIGSVHQELYLIKKENGQVNQQSLLPVRFVPMVKE